MTQPRSHTPDKCPARGPGIRRRHPAGPRRRFRRAVASRDVRGAGTEPIVEFCIEGVPVFYFRRDEFLDAMYVAGCDAMEELDRAGLPLSVAKPVPPLRLLR
jgi:hypothetical protein